MRDSISIGSAPCDEDCVQVNPQGDYHEAMRAECRRFLELIRKKLGPEPPGARLAIKSNPHDFGIYYDVVCFDDEHEEARHYALRCERGMMTSPTRRRGPGWRQGKRLVVSIHGEYDEKE